MKVAVVGAGIYGCTIALKLAEEGFDVDLIEREDDIMKVATPISLRAHMGYFYARSPKTMRSCRETAGAFRKLYPAGVVDGSTHYYMIAKKGSKISGKEFLEVLDKNGFAYQNATEALVDSEHIDVSVKVEEYSYDPDFLREEVRKKLSKSSVRLLIKTDVADTTFVNYDLKIIAAYAANNDVTRLITGEPAQEYEYRLCEKVVVRLPAAFSHKNFVLLDGPFFQIDPLGADTELFVLSHHVHSVHSRHEGNFFDIEPEKRALLGKGVVRNPWLTNAPSMIQAIATFIPETLKAEVVGSLYAIKPLVPKNAEDARPVNVTVIRKDVLTVLSGKVSGSITAAEECLLYARKISTF